MARIKKSLVAQLGEAKVELDAAKERYDALADAAREALAMGAHQEGVVTVSLSPNRTWNKAKALENYGEEICSMQVDQKLAQKKLTGEEYEALYVDGAPRVVVKIGD